MSLGSPAASWTLTTMASTLNASLSGNSSSSGNGTLTCFGTEPGEDVLGQVIHYACIGYSYVIALVKTIPLDYNLALGLVLGGAALFLILFCCCCCCCCKRCCCPSEKSTKKKRKRIKKEYDYLDPADAPAIKSKRNPKTNFDMIPLVGTTIEEKVQPSLYSIPANSMLQSGLYDQFSSEDIEGKVSLGRLQFSMKVDGNVNKECDLEVQVIQAVELNPQSQCKSGTPDPYVSVTLEPKNVHFETRVDRQNCDPMFQEKFTFPSVKRINTQRLLFQAWHFDRINVSNPPMGQVGIDLSKYDLEKPVEEWHRFKEVDLQAFQDSSKTRMRFGCLCISLQFNQPTNKLILFVLEASDLPADPGKKEKEEKDGRRSKSQSRSGNRSSAEKEEEVKIDPMVKASIKLDGKKVKKEKTSTKTNTTNPYYNEKLTFEVTPEHIKRVVLSVAVVHCRLGAEKIVGRVVMGPDTTGRAGQHWMDMQETPGRPVAQWHVLSDPKSPKKSKH